MAEPVSPRGIEPLDDVIRRHIEGALRETHGRVEGRFGAATPAPDQPAYAARPDAETENQLAVVQRIFRLKSL